MTLSEIYTSKIGVKELTGKNDGPFVDEVLKLCNFDNPKQVLTTGKGYDWCAAFVSWCFDQAKIKAIKNAWAPSWFPPSKTVYMRGEVQHFAPQRGDVFGLWYQPQQLIGHVGFIDEWSPGDTCITVEGNWGGQVSKNIRKKAEIFKVSRWGN